MSLLSTANRLHLPPWGKCSLRFVHSNPKSGLMKRLSLLSFLLCGLLMAPAWAQSTPAAAPSANPNPVSPAPAGGAPAASGGLIHGTVKAGNIPLPGVSVVATNTLTGQRYATVTDINGNYSMTIPANGRYVLKTELAAFGPETKTVLIKSATGPTTASPVDQQADFAVTLASRVPPETPQENVASATAPGQRPAATVRRIVNMTAITVVEANQPALLLR